MKGDPCPAMDLAAAALDARKGYYKTNHCPSQDDFDENAFFSQNPIFTTVLVSTVSHCNIA
ncbi:uncharacterized protein N7473_006444 [Penicillium subrubescens]|uniref:uncharacterized protein n=1 Tax=Penicillium subrubescens TaxID=1316194 RepID=UPI0025454CF8|nr:uncharacterized protein N7473_006444 [Penicillium subrubescens]KAJ5897045.1 hypothetical protein N7473_006444 [Penicillium subrubescens]